MLVSIVIPCFNQGHFLGEAVDSALAQTHRRVEVLIIDDGSTDATPSVARRYAQIQYVKQKNAGVATARNAGLRKCSGEFVAFLDADDVLFPQAISLGLKFYAENPNCAFVYGGVVPVGEALDRIDDCQLFDPESADYLSLLQGNHIRTPGAVLFRREILIRHGGFNPLHHGCADWEVYLRLARENPIGCHNGLVLKHRRHSANMSENTSLMLSDWLATLRAQQSYIRGRPDYERAARLGRVLGRRIFLKRELLNFRDPKKRRHASWQIAVQIWRSPSTILALLIEVMRDRVPVPLRRTIRVMLSRKEQAVPD